MTRAAIHQLTTIVAVWVALIFCVSSMAAGALLLSTAPYHLGLTARLLSWDECVAGGTVALVAMLLHESRK